MQYNDLWRFESDPGNGIQGRWTEVYVPAPRPVARVYFGYSAAWDDIFTIRGGKTGGGETPLSDEWYLTLSEPVHWSNAKLSSSTVYGTQSGMGFTNLGSRYITYGGDTYGFTHATNPFWSSIWGNSTMLPMSRAGVNPSGRTGLALSTSRSDILMFGGVVQNAGKQVRGLFLGDLWKYRAREACPPGELNAACYQCTAGSYVIAAPGESQRLLRGELSLAWQVAQGCVCRALLAHTLKGLTRPRALPTIALALSLV